jgi:hypothetical protein
VQGKNAAPAPENRRDAPLDPRLPVWQDAATMSAGEDQFSLTRAASTTAGAAKSRLLSVTPDPINRSTHLMGFLFTPPQREHWGAKDDTESQT